MSRVALLLLVMVGGCQCLQPVIEDSDAGLDGGVDAGADAGPTTECRQSNDCVPVTPPRMCAFSGDSASRSCLDGRCVFDCQGARTCSTQLGACLSCDGGVPACATGNCSAVTDGTTGRIYRTCTPGSSDALGTFVVHDRAGATCNFKVYFGDGGVFGELGLLGDDVSSSAEVMEEPRVTCSVRGLATALNRLEIGCARCFYLLEWP
jgi:hypothetical protein